MDCNKWAMVCAGVIALIAIYYIVRPFIDYEAMKSEERRMRQSYHPDEDK